MRSTCSTSVSQSTEFDSAEERINLNTPNIASDDIAKILPPNRSYNADKLYSFTKKSFSSIWRNSNGIRFLKICCTAKGQRFLNLKKKNHFRTYSWLIYSESRKGLHCKYCAIFSAFLVNCGVGKNRQKPGKLVIKLLCSFNKLTGSNGFLYEHDRFEYHKSMTMTIEVKWRCI